MTGIRVSVPEAEGLTPLPEEPGDVLLGDLAEGAVERANRPEPARRAEADHIVGRGFQQAIAIAAEEAV